MTETGDRGANFQTHKGLFGPADQKSYQGDYLKAKGNTCKRAQNTFAIIEKHLTSYCNNKH